MLSCVVGHESLLSSTEPPCKSDLATEVNYAFTIAITKQPMDLYDLLEVPADADLASIRKAYKRLLLQVGLVPIVTRCSRLVIMIMSHFRFRFALLRSVLVFHTLVYNTHPMPNAPRNTPSRFFHSTC